MNLIGIYNEEGNREDDLYKVLKSSTGTKNVIEICNTRTGEKRLIHKDRTFLLENKRSATVEKEKKTQATESKKKAKKKKPLVKFDLKDLEDVGILFRSKKKSSMDVGGQKISIESFCIVSSDGAKWKHFNLYNHSLGKKSKPPQLTDGDNVKMELSGNLEAIEKYLEKKGYLRTE